MDRDKQSMYIEEKLTMTEKNDGIHQQKDDSNDYEKESQIF